MATPGSFAAGTALTAADMNLLPGGVGTGDYFAQVAASQTPITSIVDLSGLSLAKTFVPNRRIQVTLSAMLQSSVAGDRMDLILADGANTILMLRSAAASTANINESFTLVAVVTSTGSSQTFKGRAQRGGGSGNLTMSAGATSPAFLLLQDIGPV